MEEIKYAVVTGGTRGIGKAISERLLEEGYTVLAAYAQNQEAAEKMMEQYADTSRFSVIQKELFDYKSAVELAKMIRERFPWIDVLVLNSAITDFTPFEDILPKKWMHVMNVNLNAPFFLIQQLADRMRAEVGRIILMGSHVGNYPHARSVSYGVSKAAVHALARYLVKYFSPKGITVNCVVPGTIETSWHDEKTPEHKQRIMDKIALHRFGLPEEVAELCMELIRNQYINGALLDIDGGYSYR